MRGPTLSDPTAATVPSSMMGLAGRRRAGGAGMLAAVMAQRRKQPAPQAKQPAPQASSNGTSAGAGCGAMAALLRQPTGTVAPGAAKQRSAKRPRDANEISEDERLIKDRLARGRSIARRQRERAEAERAEVAFRLRLAAETARRVDWLNSMDTERAALKVLAANLAEQRGVEQRLEEEAKMSHEQQQQQQQQPAVAAAHKLTLLSFFRKAAPKVAEGGAVASGGAAGAGQAGVDEPCPMSWALALQVQSETAALQAEAQVESTRQSEWAAVLEDEKLQAEERRLAELARAAAEAREQEQDATKTKTPCAK
jgi:hypothetical protein